jgi:outer membrane receptor protein involved in Fe transport
MRKLVGLKLFVGISLMAILGALFGPMATAQTVVTGELDGTVKDSTGGVMSNVKVTVKSEATGETRTATTSAVGEYHIALLRPGSYTISATASGFQPSSGTAIVSLGQVSPYNMVLSVTQQTDIVEVSVQEPLLQTENANVSTNLNSLQVQNLPVPGNDITSFTYTAPGATQNTSGSGYGAFSAFGMPATSNLYTINGMDNTDPYLNQNNSGASNLTLGANEIQEVAIISNGYTGQYGRQAGTQVNFITRSGSNAFHGNGYWDWNGDKLDANDWFNNYEGTPRPHQVNNAWAASVGGPVVKNKLFFFVDQEGLRYVLPGGGPVWIPTPAFASYVLTQVTPSAVPFYTQIFKVYDGAPGAANARPLSAAVDGDLGCGDFTGGGFVGGIITPTTVGKPCAEIFENTANSLNEEWLLTTRVDYNMTDRDVFSFRFLTDHGVQATSTDPINSAFSANSIQPQYSGQFSYTRTISANSVNNLMLSELYYVATFGPPNINAALAVFPTTLYFYNGDYSSMAGVYPHPLYAYPSGRRVSQPQLIDDYAYIHGAHEFKLGITFRRDDVADLAYGVFTSGVMVFDSMTDFVTGILNNGSTYTQNFTRVEAEHIDLYNMGIYGQDQWKISPKLSLTLALRLDRAKNPSCGTDCFAGLGTSFENLAHSATLPYNSAIQLGMSNLFRSIDPIIPEPRIGLAYSLDNKTVVRGGFGLFADQFPGTLISNFFLNPPNVLSFTTASGSGLVAAPGVANSAFTNVANSNTAFQSGFASGATLATLQANVPGFSLPNLYTQANQFHLARYGEWNLEVQRELRRDLVLAVNYVGNHGWDEINQNTFPNAWSPTGFGGLPTTVPDARFGQINELSSTGHSNYDGLTSSLRWRFQSFFGQLNYTWSHALDTCSNNCVTPFNDGYNAANLNYDINPAGANWSYGNADYDVRHTFNANYVWMIPSYFKEGALKTALGGWTIGGTFQAHSGYPFTVINSSLVSANIHDANVSIPADWLGGSASKSCTTPNAPCFMASEFAATGAQTNFGNIARNSFRGPGYFDTDLSVNKSFALTERYHVTVGANFFNFLNHPNFALPENDLASGSFGQITSTVSPFSSPYGSFQGASASGRIIQMVGKFQF